MPVYVLWDERELVPFEQDLIFIIIIVSDFTDDNYVSEIALRTWCIYTRRHLDYIIYGINIYMFISPVILCYNYIVSVVQY